MVHIMSDAESVEFDAKADINIAIDIDETGGLQKLSVDVIKDKLQDYAVTFLVIIKFNEEFVVGEWNKKWLGMQLEELFRSIFMGTSPEILEISTRSGSLFLEFLAMFSGVSFLQLIKKYGEIRSGAILLANDIAQATQWIRAYLIRSTAENRAGREKAEAMIRDVTRKSREKAARASITFERPKEETTREGEEDENVRRAHRSRAVHTQKRES
jgi:hypothetical protein